jgi:periplasmic protein CpxP/Spy
MKKVMMMLALTAGVNTAVFAQSANKSEGRAKLTTEQRAEKQTDRMVKALELNDKQRQQLLELNTESAKTVKQINEERRAKLKVVREQRNQKLKSILTPEQFARLEAKKAERKQKMQEKRATMRQGKGGFHRGHENKADK